MRHRFLFILVCVGSSAATHAEQSINLSQGRTYKLYVPATVKAAGKPAPLVLVLHGGSGTGQQMRAWTGFDTVADRYGFVVAYPDALDKSWNDGRRALNVQRASGAAPDDVGFLTTLVANLIAQNIADPARVYVTGASNGGMMTFRLACETTGVFAGFATVIANLSMELAESCAPKASVRMLMMNGTADAIVPYTGGVVARSRGTVIGAEASFLRWAARNGCQAMPPPVRLPDTVPVDRTTVDVHACPGQRAIFYRINGGGHQWPSPSHTARPLIDRFLGHANRDIEAADHIWRFFAGKL